MCVLYSDTQAVGEVPSFVWLPSGELERRTRPVGPILGPVFMRKLLSGMRFDSSRVSIARICQRKVGQ